MKKIFALAVFCSMVTWGFAQNTFPSSGNVGIGTSTPDFPLEVEVPDNTNGIILGNSTGAKFFMKVNATGGGQLFVRNTGGADRIFLNANGQSFFMNTVGIGLNPVNNVNGYKLAVNGLIGSKEVQIENTSAIWPDYVFDEEYNLMSLEETKYFIEANKHLPNVPSAKEIETQGGSKVGETDVILLQKIEEITLHLIEQNEKIKELQSQVKALQKENQELSSKTIKK